MRKTLSLVLAVLMVLALLPAVKLSAASAEDAAPTYTKVESAADLTDGSYLIVVDSKKLDGAYYTFNGTTATQNNLVRVESIVDNTIEGDFAANEIKIAAVEGGFTLKNSEGKYLGAKSGSNTVVFDDTAVVNGITINDDLTVSINMTFDDEARELKLNNSNDQPFFRYYLVSYSNKNIYLPSLYKKVESTEPEPSPSESTEPSPSAEPETTAMELVTELADGDEVVIYYPDSSKVVTGKEYYYEHATDSSKNKWELIAGDATLTDGVLAAPAEALVLTVSTTVADDEETTLYTFKTADDKYLYADATDVKLVEAQGENTLFQLETAENGFYIKCDSAVDANSNAVYVEYYKGYFTVYKMGTAKYYTFQFFAESEEPVEPPVIEPTGDTIILFTNDVHCGIEDNWGYAGLAKVKKDLEAAGNEVILVDAGDHSQGGDIGTLSNGEYLIDIMNFVGYDLAIPGNHEFDYGMDQFLDTLVTNANYPYVSANFVNLVENNPNGLVLDAYKIFEANGKKIAFVGLSTPETITKSTPTYFQDADGNYIYGFCQDSTGEGVYTAAQNAIDAAKAEGADY
ncbi:MAG: metallophosphoesterase, partial [Clostridia bacterium]|nr:metallophosphoesterase [Clostridia bacterium]